MEKHLQALEAVRETGAVNMMAGAVVVQLLQQMGYDDTAEYLLDDRGRVDRKKYLDLLQELGKMRRA